MTEFRRRQSPTSILYDATIMNGTYSISASTSPNTNRSSIRPQKNFHDIETRRRNTTHEGCSHLLQSRRRRRNNTLVTRMDTDSGRRPRRKRARVDDHSFSLQKFAPTIFVVALSMFLSSVDADRTLSSGMKSASKKHEIQQIHNALHDRNLQQSLQQCEVALGVVDRDRDDTLTREEYLRFVKQLSSKSLEEQKNQYAVLSSFDEFPQRFKDNYEYFLNDDSGNIDISGAKPGQVATSEQEIKIQELCEFTGDLILENDIDSFGDDETSPDNDDFGSITPISEVECNLTVDRGQCNVDLSISDSFQNNLLSENDYVRFVNRLSNNEYANFLFDEFPSNFQENFYKFANKDGNVNILGSKPGQRVSDDQDKFLDAFCCETNWVIQNPGVATTEAPASQPDGFETSAPTFDPFFCQRSMASSDLDRNDKLDEEGYVIFLNRLTDNEFIGQSYDELGPTLQSNYENLVGDDDQIDIYGSKPGQTPNEEQKNNLLNICDETGKALSSQSPSSDSIAPSLSPIEPSLSPIEIPTSGSNEPTLQITLPPTFDDKSCYVAMATSDSDNDGYLDQQEFAFFVIRLTGAAFEGLTFEDLPTPISEVYYSLLPSNETAIYIYGSKPDDLPDLEQETYLEEICLDVAVGYSQTEGWTKPPVSGPPGSSTFAPGLSEAYNSFIISNRGGLTAADLSDGTMSREGLNEAYAMFVERSIEESDVMIGSVPPTESIGMRRQLRGRKLKIDLSPDSDEIYLIEDSDCPEGVPSGSLCQTAFARFQLIIGDEDPNTVSKVYTNYTQTLISERFLDIILKEVDPRTILKIIDASYPVTPLIDESSESPSMAPIAGSEPENPKKKRNLAGPIIGGIIGAILLCAVFGYVSTKGLPFEIPSFLTRRKARIDSKRDDFEDEEGGLGFGRDDDDASIGDKNSFNKRFGINNDTFGDEDDENEDEQKDRNRFGFAKKKKKEEEIDIDFGIDSQQDASTTFGTGNNMYAFEEPSEVDSHSGSQDDQKSAVESEDQLFGAASETTPTWGAEQAFGSGSTKSGWGTGGAFFGKSAFEDDQEEEDVSESVSESSYSSEDETYQTGDQTDARSGQDSKSFGMDDADQDDSYSGSSSEYSSSNAKSVSEREMSNDLKLQNENMDAAIENEDWDAIVDAAKALEKSDQDSSIAGSSKKMEFDVDDDMEDDDSYSDSYSESGDASATSATTTSEDLEKRAEYRTQVEELVRIVLPDETEKVDAMMDQFKGREAELVSTLQTMEERSANQRARAAVHKSKPPANQHNTTYSMGGVNGGGIHGGEGSTAGTAAIAAASLPIPAEDMFDDEDQNGGFGGFGAQNTFGADDEFGQEGSQYSDEYEDRSYYSGEEGTGSRSFYSGDEGSGSRSFYSDEGSQSRSYYSDEGSQPRSYYSEEGSQPQSFYSQEGSQSRSYNSQEDSRPRSYYSQEGSGSRSYYSEEGSQSYYSGEESYYSGDEPREQSVYSEEGSQYEE